MADFQDIFGANMRDLIKTLSPATLQSGRAERYMYTIGLMKDALLEKCRQGVSARFPQYCHPSFLPLIGQNELCDQGITEDNISYASRLKRWIDVWPRAGNADGFLCAMRCRLLAFRPRARTVSSRYVGQGRIVATYDAAGHMLTPTHGSLVPSAISQSIWNTCEAGTDPMTTSPDYVVQTGAAAGFDWDSASRVNGSGGWWHFWVIFYSTGLQTFVRRAPKWGTPGVKWGSRSDLRWGYLVDLDASPANGIDGSMVPALGVGAALRATAHLWRNKGAPLRNIIISFDDTLFDPTAPAGGGINPDGTFGRPAKLVGYTYVATRFANARYLRGDMQ